MNLPQGISIPSAATHKLKLQERLASFPCSGDDCICHTVPQTEGGGRTDAPQEDVMVLDTVVRSSIQTRNPHHASIHRRVLVVFLPLGGSHTYMWIHPNEVIPWGETDSPCYTSAIQALRDHQFTLKDELRKAITDAKASVALKAGATSQEVERIRRTRAAVAAAGVDLKRRCGRCQTCCTNAGVRSNLFECLYCTSAFTVSFNGFLGGGRESLVV